MKLWIRADQRPLFGALDFEGFLALGEHTVRIGPDGARRTAWFERDGRRFYLKVHSGVGWKEIVKCLLQGKHPIVDARPEALALERLAELGIPAPRLVAFGLRGHNPARRHSFVLTEGLVDTEDLGEFLAREHDPTPRLRQALARELGRIVGAVHAAGLAHQDLYLTHFRLRRGEGEQFELFLLDLHRARRGAMGTLRWRLKDLAALRFSSLDLATTRTDCARFWHAYRIARPAGLGPDERGLRRGIEQRARIVHRRVARRGPAGQVPG